MKSVINLFCVCLLFVYYLCEKYYKAITVRYHIANGISWVTRLTLLVLQSGLTNLLSEWNLFVCRGLTLLALVVLSVDSIITISISISIPFYFEGEEWWEEEGRDGH